MSALPVASVIVTNKTVTITVIRKISTAMEMFSSPNVGSLLHPFKRTPLDVVSMRKCLTSSASGSPPNITFTINYQITKK